ncbi:MAG: flagellar hook assembly protein FlgD [bacterium]|nr:flagellar hook assembly protein FlgD [bacterium]
MNVIDGVATTNQNATMTDSLMKNEDLGKDAFLKLLLVQLQNQDPMEPVKNEDFIAQLAQFSSLEQLQSINTAVSGDKEVDATAGVEQAIMSNTAISLMGKQVDIASDSISYTGGDEVEVGYNLAGPANQVGIQIFDQSGNLVQTLSASTTGKNSGTITWDGKDADGRDVPAGTYNIVPGALNGQGGSVGVTAGLTGTVTGVRYENGKPILVMGGGEADLSGVARVY